MTISELLSGLDIPSAYGRFTERQKPPYILYLGSGQGHFIADSKIYAKQDEYQVEYYFIDKSKANEDAIEDAFINNGYMYEKSEDVWIEDENVFVVYYTVWRP